MGSGFDNETCGAVRTWSLRELPSAIMLLPVEQERIKANHTVLRTAARLQLGMNVKDPSGRRPETADVRLLPRSARGRMNQVVEDFYRS
jgi:hypothetical protein